MTVDPAPLTTPSVKDVTAALFAQLMRVMGVKPQNWLATLLYPILHFPIQRMSELLVDVDLNTPIYGWNNAVNLFLHHFITGLHLHNSESLPIQGPLIVVCNHPAALDVVILTAAVKRDDLKIVASDIPILQMFPYIRQHIIPVYYNIPMRLGTVRNTIRHLEQRGTILIFPRGDVEPDPAVSPGAVRSLDGWSPSIELFLRRVPQTRTVVAIASGMLSAGWYKNPLINLWKKYEQRQKVAEIFQIAAQLVTGRTPGATPTVTFSPPLSLSDLGGAGVPEGALLAALTGQAKDILSRSPSLLA
jgi:hypothetical protein